MRVRDLMEQSAVTCAPATSLVEAGEVMRREDIESLPVVDDRGQIVGIVTDRDIVLRGLAEGLGRLRPRCNDTHEAEQENVRALVARPVVDVAPYATLRAVAETMDEEAIGVVVVRTPHPPGRDTRALGLVSERDIVRAVAGGADPDRGRAEDVMTIDLACVRPDEPVLSAARRMLENEIRHLPVMEDDTVIGVISARDALQLVVDEPERR